MSLPLSIQSKLTETYDGVQAARFMSSIEARNFESELTQAKISYKTKITKSKKLGRAFMVVVWQ